MWLQVHCNAALLFNTKYVYLWIFRDGYKLWGFYIQGFTNCTSISAPTYCTAKRVIKVNIFIFFFFKFDSRSSYFLISFYLQLLIIHASFVNSFVKKIVNFTLDNSYFLFCSRYFRISIKFVYRGASPLGGYLQQRQLASEEKSTHSLYKYAQLHNPTASIVQYTRSSTLTSPVCVPGTKRLLFPFYTYLYHYNHQKCIHAIVNYVQLLHISYKTVGPLKYELLSGDCIIFFL